MECNFDNREPVSDLVSVPAGTYLCKIADVRERLTRNDDALWAIRLVVDEGEFTGRVAAWDNLVFSSRGLNRVKRVFEAIGLPADGKVDVDPSHLLDRQVFVQVRPAEYLSPDGTSMRRNEVPYDGYRAVENDSPRAAPSASDNDTVPF